RDGPAALHRTQQSVLEHQPRCANGEPTGRHLPIRPLTLRGLAEAGVDRSLDHYGHRTRPQHHCPRAHCIEEGVMSTAAVNRVSPPSVSAPVAAHAPVDMRGLIEKVAIRNLDFFYGETKALKGISLSLYANKTTAFIGPSGCGKSTLLRILN